MHKIKKGIKKKIKGKKDKGSDLFDPAELEKYKKELKETAEGKRPAFEDPDAPEAKEESEEWQRFKALTAGIDDVLNKTKGDLTRIKTTSYFQKKKTATEENKENQPAAQAPAPAAQKKPEAKKRWVGFEDGSVSILDGEEAEEVDNPAAAGATQEEVPPDQDLLEVESELVEEEEEEEDFEADEDIFDTSYVDIVTSGEVKLVYIPESPTETEEGGFDPFDTSIAEKVIKTEEKEIIGKDGKKKKLVSLGCAVDVLTGRLDKPLSSTPSLKKRRVVPKRPEDIDLLFGDSEVPQVESSEVDTEKTSKSLLDDDAPVIPTTPVNDILGALVDSDTNNEKALLEPLEDILISSETDKEAESEKKREEKSPESKQEEGPDLKDLVAEFDIINAEPELSAPLPARSSIVELIQSVTGEKQEEPVEKKEEEDLEDEFAALAKESASKSKEATLEQPQSVPDLCEEDILGDDPFDTTAADVILGVKEDNTSVQVSSEVSYTAADPFCSPVVDPFATPDIDALLTQPVSNPPTFVENSEVGKNSWEGFDEDQSQVIVSPEEHKPKRPPPPRPAASPSRPSQPPTRPTPPRPPLPASTPTVPVQPIQQEVDLFSIEEELTQAPLVFKENEIEAIRKDLVNGFENEIDPFDTTFAENIAPGKLELKIIESEILGDIEANEARILSQSDSDIEFDPRAEERIQSEVTIHISIPPEDQEELDRIAREEALLYSGLETLKLSHRDLLGGSTTDLSKLGHNPIEPASVKSEVVNDDDIDPFDTSVVDDLAPGKAELKVLEKELLEDVQTTIKRSISDPDFNPREEDSNNTAESEVTPVQEPAVKPERPKLPPALTRPDLLEGNTENPSSNEKQFDLPSPSARPDLLVVGEEGDQFSKLLTPLVESKPLQVEEEVDLTADPFDTSFASNILPGKAELKLIENELVGIVEQPTIKHSLSDPDFNPRGEDDTPVPQELPQQEPEPIPTVVFQETITDRPKTLAIPVLSPKPDLLDVDDDIPTKLLTPAVENNYEVNGEDTDPFDTSIASNILPGKAELKVLEKELISGEVQPSIKRSYTDPDFNPRENNPPVDSIHDTAACQEPSEAVNTQCLPVSEKPDLLNLPDDIPASKTLTPLVEDTSFTFDDSVDPFDTSLVSSLVLPGKAELKILESELIGQ